MLFQNNISRNSAKMGGVLILLKAHMHTGSKQEVRGLLLSLFAAWYEFKKWNSLKKYQKQLLKS